jgi:hypothetical protein
MNVMNIAQGIDIEALHAQQEETLKKMTKGKLISYVGKMEAELTAYRNQIAELQKANDDKKTRLAYVEGKLAINAELLKDVKQERDDLKGQVAKMRDILDEAEEKNLIFYRDHEYCFNGDIPASWSDESFEGLQASARHLEGFHKLLKVIHEADPITGMW